MKNLLRKFSVLLSFLLLLSDASAQLLVPFTQRTSPVNPGVTIYNVKGDFTMIGNTNLTLQNYGDNTSNNNPMIYVDVDNDNSTLNSSSAKLSLNGGNTSNGSCSQVVYAGLYWTGRAHDGANSPNNFSVTKNGVTVALDKQIVKLKGPTSSSYTSITATSTDIYYPQNSDGFMYSSYAEITQYVQNNGVEGLYTVADIALNEGNGGSTGFYGGWGMIVIYGNNDLPLKDITVFDGHAYVAGNITADFNIPLSGFNSTQSGPVNVKMGMIAGEGDRNISGDFFQIRNADNTAWINLNHGANSANNFFNSSIFTGGNTRIPDLLNNTGLDISMFDLPNTNNSLIANNQTSTTFRYGTTQDTYIIFSIVFAVDAYQPDIVGVNTLETVNNVPVPVSPVVLPGEDLGYTLDVFNFGNEPITDGQIIIPIPYNATFVSANGNYLFTPNSNTTPYFDPTMGSNGSIVWNIGALPVPTSPNDVLAELSYTLSATEDCLILANTECENVIEVNGTIGGIGAITGTSLLKNFISGYNQSTNCSGSPITDPISVPINASEFVLENCSDVQTSYSFIFCGLQNSQIIQTNQISGSFPVGTRFFDSNPVTTSSVEYTTAGFPAIPGTSTYYAYPQGIDAPCAIELTITVIDSSLTTVPEVVDYVYCLNETAEALTAVSSNNTNSIYYYSDLGGSPSGQIIPSTAVAGNFVYYAVEAISNNCISTGVAPINVTVYEPGTAALSGINGSQDFSATVTAGSEICFEVFIQNSQSGQEVDLTYTNGLPGATFTSNDQEGTGTFCWTPDASEQGSFDVVLTLTDNCGNSENFNYQIIVESTPCNVAVTVESTQDIACSVNDGSAVITASGGLAPYTFTLMNNTTGEIFSSTSGIFNNLTNGNYSVFVVDANNCQPECTNLNFDISGSFEPIDAEISTSSDPCNNTSGGSIVITASGGTPDYLYSIGNQFQSSNTFTGLTGGTYQINLIDANGCSYTASATIEQNLPLNVDVTNVVPDFCGLNNGSFIINVSGGSAPYYTEINGQPGNVGIISGLASGSYTVLVTDANNCSGTGSATITSPSPLETSISDVFQPNCVVSSGSFSTSVSGGTSPYLFDLNGVQNSNGSFTNLAPGNYSVIATDANGCTSSSTVEITTPTELIASVISVENATCGQSNGQVTVEVSQGTGPYTYSLNGNPVSGTTYSNLTAGTYEILITDANLCTESLVVNLSGTPAFTISGEQTDVSCNGTCDGEISINSTSSSISYVWSDGSTGSSLTGLCAGIYSVQATDPNGCEQQMSFTINEPAQLNLSVISTSNEDCNSNNGSATISATGGTSPYTYSIAGSSQTNVILNNNGVFEQLSSGSYAYFVTDANGCSIECIQLFFIADDCDNNNSSGAGLGRSNPNSTQLLVTKSNNSYKVNYTISGDNPMQLVLLNAEGSVSREIELNLRSGKFDISDDTGEMNFVFAILKDKQGNIQTSTRIK